MKYKLNSPIDVSGSSGYWIGKTINNTPKSINRLEKEVSEAKVKVIHGLKDMYDEWCVENNINVQYEVEVEESTVLDNFIDVKSLVCLDHEEDAMAFKLRWLD